MLLPKTARIWMPIKCNSQLNYWSVELPFPFLRPPVVWYLHPCVHSLHGRLCVGLNSVILLDGVPSQELFGCLSLSGVHIWMFPKIGGTPKWMAKIRETPIKMDDLGGNTTIFGNTHMDVSLNSGPGTTFNTVPRGFTIDLVGFI